MEKRLPLPTGTVLQNRYRIVRQLGHGGFGAVYEAVDDEINLSFALKETFYAADEELRAAFKREARMLARLSHEAFPRVTHYFTEGDGCFLVMELIEGDDLDKLLSKRAAPFEQEQVLTWADQILDALEDLHEKDIVHRDIKPSNLKLTPKGKIKLLDFGIAKGAVEGETTILTTVGSLAAATLQYAPLEQVLKASPQYQMMLSVVSSDKVMEIMKRGTDAASDLYSLAATFYHLLTKQLPADAPTRALAIWSGQHDRLIPAHQTNPQIKREVSEVLQKAMSLDRAERYQTATEMRQALKEAEKTVAEIKPEPVPPTEPAPTAHRFVEPETEVLLPLSEVETVKSNSQTESPQTPDLSKLLYQKDSNKKASQPEATRSSDSPEPNDEQIIKLRDANKKTAKSKEKANFGLMLGASSLILILVLGLIVYFSVVNKDKIIDVSNKNTNSTPNIPADAKYKLAQTLTGHSDSVWSIVFSPDGKTIASGSVDGTIKLWDATSGTLKQTLESHNQSVYSVVFSPDGRTVASGSLDNTIKLWDAASGALKQTLESHKDMVNSVAFSPDGKTIVNLPINCHFSALKLKELPI